MKKKRREDCIKGIKDVEEIMKDKMSGENDEEPMERYMKCGDILLYKSSLASRGRFLRNRRWEEISENEWDEEKDKKNENKQGRY